MSIWFYLAFTACLVKVYKKSAYFKHTCMCALMYCVHMFFKVWQLFLKLNKWYCLAVTTDINREVKDAEFRQQLNICCKKTFHTMNTLNSMRSSLFREENFTSGRSLERTKSSLRKKGSLEILVLAIREGGDTALHPGFLGAETYTRLRVQKSDSWLC